MKLVAYILDHQTRISFANNQDRRGNDYTTRRLAPKYDYTNRRLSPKSLMADCD